MTQHKVYGPSRHWGVNFDPRTLKITSYGKFEGQPRWLPHFYELWLEEGNTGNHHSFYVNAADTAQFPELREYYKVELYEDDQGNVWGTAVPEPREHK